jgi:hypothetical protein
MNQERQTAYQEWIAILDKLAVASPQEQLELRPQARAAYKRCLELNPDRVAPRQRIHPPRFPRPDGEAGDREYSALKDRP